MARMVVIIMTVAFMVMRDNPWMVTIMVMADKRQVQQDDRNGDPAHQGDKSSGWSDFFQRRHERSGGDKEEQTG